MVCFTGSLVVLRFFHVFLISWLDVNQVVFQLAQMDCMTAMFQSQTFETCSTFKKYLIIQMDLLYVISLYRMTVLQSPCYNTKIEIRFSSIYIKNDIVC